jgi:hypothetical protein
VNLIDPKNQEAVIFSKLLTNRDQVCKEHIPAELQDEFVQEIFPDDVLRLFAEELQNKGQFSSSRRGDFVDEFMHRSMSKNRFGVRLQIAGVDSKVVISRLLQDI